MIDHILQHQPNWRYCRVRSGEKRPYPANWQHNPLTLEQVDSSNIGLMLGPASGGVCAIDFDGFSAWNWAEANGINTSKFLPTPIWTSGKPGRCQIAFHVPEEYWHVLKTVKVTHTKDSAIREGEGFEFRWTGGQSVLPPSMHPDTGKPYEWLVDATTPIATIPDSVLVAWLEQLQPRIVDSEPVELPDMASVKETEFETVNNLLGLIKQKYAQLDYDTWLSVTWAVFGTVGLEIGTALMQSYYPEQKTGEYRNLAKTYRSDRNPPRLGTLRHLVKDELARANNTGSIAATQFRKQQRLQRQF